MSLLASKILGLFEIPQILVVHDDRYRVFYSSEIVAPLLECLYDSEKFPVIDVVVLLCWGKCCGVVGTRVEVSIGVLLYEYPSSGSEGSTSHDEEWCGGIWHFDFWSREEHFLELDECIVLFLSP